MNDFCCIDSNVEQADVVYKDYFIPAGSAVVINLW